MRSGKMAARWRGEDADFNADDGDLLAGDAPIELVLSRGDVEVVKMDTQSCTDHSILAIFEDSTVASEGKSEGEDESETLLSVLTEMLDSVEDDDGTLSPFDILPDTKLLTHLDCRDNSVAPSFADRLRPRPKFTNVTFTVKRDGEKEDENNMERNSLPQLLRHQSQTLFPSKAKKAEKNEVEVFTSTSLVNLVKLMHPYCLKLHVEEGDKLRKNHTLFSKEEVWKYERPSEESDEEINVVSDDEEPVKETKGKEDGEEKRDDRTLLKSVLLNGNSPRVLPFKEKKRVSFGPVQVASFNEPAEKGFNKKNLTSGHTSETVSVPLDSTKALGNPAGLALEPQTISSSEMNIDKAEILPPKGETKAKSLSLQQYRQLRQKRKPLVETQRNYTTKWPSVSEPPKELPPILCLQGQRQNSCGPKTAHHYPDYTRLDINHLHNPGYKTVSHKASLPSRPSPSQTNKPNHLHCSRLKHPRLESKTISPDSPLPDATTNLNVNVPVSKKSPEKNPTLLSSDPPNPVLLPLPVSHSPSPSTDLSSSEYKIEFVNIDSNLESTAHLKKIQNDSSAAFPHRQPCSSEPKPQVLLANQDGSTLLQETKDKFTNITSGVSFRSPALRLAPTQTVSASECNKPQPQKHSLSPTKAAGEALEPKIPKLPSPYPVRQIKCPSSMPFSAPACSADASIPMEKEALPKAPLSTISPEEPPATHQVGSRAQSAASDSVIEAPDLTSLLEQFEETQAKVERVCENKPCLVSANPPSNLQIEGHMELDRSQPVGSEKISRLLLTPTEEPLDPSESTGTPKTLRNLPHLQMLERVDIPEPLGTEIILSTQQEQPARRKNPPSKAIQIIDPRPLPSKKNYSSASEPPPAHTSLHMCSSISADHDYCRPVDHSLTSFTQRSRAKPPLLKDISKITNESEVNTLDSRAATEWKTQTPTRQTKSILQHHSERSRTRSETCLSTDKALQFSDCIAAIGGCGASEEKTAPCTLPTPPPSPPARGREKKRRYRRRSPHSDSSSSSSSCCSSSSSSSSSSGSRSPKRKKLHPRRSESSSCSSSPSRSITCSPPRHYRLSYSRSRCSRSRSRSWSQSRSPSRSRSPSPQICCRHWKDVYSSRESRKLRREHEIRIQKLKAIDERRVVYVGRIRRSMTHDELRERFSQFGEVECVSLHFRDRGDHYGFVTFYNMEDAFAAIDNGGKLRKPDELPFDICFGGRRQFCSSNYSDLDANRDADRSPAKSRFEDLDFDSLLKQAKRGLKR